MTDRDDDEPVLVAYPDGPFLLRGNVKVVGPDGQELPRRRRTVALCRCGKSTLKPYCDGTHKLIGFRTEPEEPGRDARDAAAD
ncbi:CDGSH iron-sulfur domain-containing protein [Curtobacterium sp. ISL-83]|uniref:CDGSH iron-sulfur domain-containing protein n=1 Tax=Curtobacterium sp. ISL-83 TaxID=2819145 RepID=UPI001BE76B9E|nr:CDGSH iron-sulfur domain-containing protein [Curtobacterium sp. ISL-83]MBT2504113.1 CDGSH iron-sulfur domain-containing protein [Curtobacterium sp. ISL-83]